MPPVFVHAMPAINPGAGGSNGPQQQQQQRTTFRPPWVKDGPEPLPMPAAPWTLARARQRGQEPQEQGLPMPNLKPVPRKNSTTTPNNVTENSSGPSGAAKTEPTPVRKTSKITIIPSRPAADAEGPKENGHDAGVKPKANEAKKPVPSQAKKQPEAKTEAKQIPIEIKSTSKPKQEAAKQVNNKKQEEPPRKSSIKAEEPKVVRPPQPPAPPMPPPPPPLGNQKPISADKAEKLDTLRSRPRKRPDWGKLMKEVETGHERLKHVKCNDRSSPLIPKTKVKGRFMYESEKPNVHNQLLKEIQGGISLKKVQTNDRSRPQLDGLRKFRRQLTIEEQIQKAEAVEEETEPDELDDIDKVRDDLQSTKQMLALELRNREAVERENKKLLTRILNIEVELEKERAKQKIAEVVSPQAMREEEEQEKRKLRKDLDEAQKTADEMESKFHDTLGQLDMARTDIEELQRKNQILERKLQASILNQENGGEPLRKQPSSKKLASAKASAADVKQVMEDDKKAEEDEESEYEEVTETETESSEEEEEDQAVLQERRTARELKLLTTKLKSFKDKEEVAKKERKSLRDQLKKQQKILKEEKKKYKQLQKEVDKVANMMKDEEDEDEEEDEEEEESESESESESEESEDEESDGDLPPEAPAERRKVNLTERSKRHENCLAALRKGNYLLKANIDRLKDDLFKQKEMSVALQEDLNSVLAELG